MKGQKNLRDTAIEMGPPFNAAGLRAQLAHGKFQGLGFKWGNHWYTTAEDREAMFKRLRQGVVHDLDDTTPKVAAAGPSGISARSRARSDRRAS